MVMKFGYTGVTRGALGLNNVDSVVTHDLSHQEMNKEWCSYSKKAPGIQWNTLENS